ncbi:hypothetical protein EUX98_g9615 [Antrodiella citrinella]|uniref:Uncharacterized protein n=1 Tax=Antrodiella citrinella TaxID=2447956 RepID=A0A4S4LVR3_9APHY|nr:hypothetical protein EUX98_g9615 [Antrodiella citrinella]
MSSYDDFEPSQDPYEIPDFDDNWIAQRREKRDVRRPETTTSQLYAPYAALDSQTTDSQFVDNLVNTHEREVLGYHDVGVQTEAVKVVAAEVKRVRREAKVKHEDNVDSELTHPRAHRNSKALEEANAKLKRLNMLVDVIRADLAVSQVRCLNKEDEIEMKDQELRELRKQLEQAREEPLSDSDEFAMLSFVSSSGFEEVLDGRSCMQSQVVLSYDEVERRRRGQEEYDRRKSRGGVKFEEVPNALHANGQSSTSKKRKLE